MGDIAAAGFKLLAVLSFLLLGIGMMLRSRPVLMLGGSLLGSVILTWVLGFLGLPIGIVFGFLGAGAFFKPRPKTPEIPSDEGDEPTDLPEP
jgi:hypothetical protein